jgi:membrane associated rhomboid family serine protease
MGIADRHYVRGDGAGPGRAAGRGSPLAMWSVNTWIIVACVAVFAIDGFLPIRWVPVGPPVRLSSLGAAPSTHVVEGEPARVRITVVEGARRVPREMTARPILDRPGGTQIGWQHVEPMRPITRWLHFSTYELLYKAGFWRVIGFQFLHANVTHLIFNMIGLYFFGPMIEAYLGRKRYLAFYLLCGIFGALAYCLLNLGGKLASIVFGADAVPGLIFNDTATPLIGASAGVFGVLMAGAYRAPDAIVLAFFIIPMRLRTLAYVLVAIAAVTVLFSGENAGGEAGHLGGALAGWYFIRRPHHLHGFFDFLGRLDPTSHHYRKGGAARRTGWSDGAADVPPGRGPGRAEVDRILDKVHAEGLASLSDREKKILREASERGTR